MASLKALKPDLKVIVTSGDYIGQEGFIVDGEIAPDGTPNQRKMLVCLPDMETSTGPFETYILPRQMEPYVETYGQSVAPVSAIVAHTEQLPEAQDITDPMDPALDRFRPDPSVVAEYVSRNVIGMPDTPGYKDTEYLLAMRDQRDSRGFSPNVALVGETQSGKTLLVNVLAVLAAERDGMPKPYPVFTLSGSSGVTSYDLFGMTTAVIINGREVLVHMEGMVPLAVKCGGFLYLDEWNAVSPSQATACHPIMDSRRMFTNTQKAVPDGHGGFSPEIVNANPGVQQEDGTWIGGLWILATINPGYKGTQTMAEATSNRFRWIPWNYDEATEQILIPSKTVRVLGDALREAREGNAITVPVGTSALQRLMADCAMFGADNALWSFKGLFPPNERARVQVIMEDSGARDLLHAEYPKPTFAAEPISA